MPPSARTRSHVVSVSVLLWLHEPERLTAIRERDDYPRRHLLETRCDPSDGCQLAKLLRRNLLIAQMKLHLVSSTCLSNQFGTKLRQKISACFKLRATVITAASLSGSASSCKEEHQNQLAMKTRLPVSESEATFHIQATSRICGPAARLTKGCFERIRLPHPPHSESL
jgi:hypothetical protein